MSGSYIGRPPISDLHLGALEAGNDLAAQLRELHRLEQLGVHSPSHVCRVKAELFRAHGFGRERAVTS